MTARSYPEFEAGLPPAIRPVSFVCVKFSAEFEHNIIKSSCVHDELNQFVIVDNRQNVFFETLGQAINAGIEQCIHDTIVVVHEDVLLVDQWQPTFERSLTALEKSDPDWCLLGAIGADEHGQWAGRCSDPNVNHNPDWRGPFAKAKVLDEQLLVIRKSGELKFDSALPTIHNMGRDLVCAARKINRFAYIIDAPTIHKYADASGKPVLSAKTSVKIQNRKNHVYIQHKACSHEYLDHKWQIQTVKKRTLRKKLCLTSQQIELLESPVVLFGTLPESVKQEKNIPLSSLVLEDALSSAMLRAIFRLYQCPDDWHLQFICDDLIDAAIVFLEENGWPDQWVLSGRNNLLIAKFLQQAFPKTVFVDELVDTVAETAAEIEGYCSLSNELDRTILPVVFDHVGIPRETILNNEVKENTELVMQYFNLQSQSFFEALSDDQRCLPVNIDGFKAFYASRVVSPAKKVSGF